MGRSIDSPQPGGPEKRKRIARRTATAAGLVLAVGYLSGCSISIPDNVWTPFGTVARAELEKAFADGEYNRGEIDWTKFKIKKKNVGIFPGASGTVTEIVREMESAVVESKDNGGHHTAKSDFVAKCL